MGLFSVSGVEEVRFYKRNGDQWVFNFQDEEANCKLACDLSSNTYIVSGSHIVIPRKPLSLKKLCLRFIRTTDRGWKFSMLPIELQEQLQNLRSRSGRKLGASSPPLIDPTPRTSPPEEMHRNDETSLTSTPVSRRLDYLIAIFVLFLAFLFTYFS